MADITGPIRTLPGARHTCPKGARCDDCDSLATIRIQGETDSFGSEMIDLCETCHTHSLNAEDVQSVCCDWCHADSKSCTPYRDRDEGTTGPVYRVCVTCVAADIRRQSADCWD